MFRAGCGIVCRGHCRHSAAEWHRYLRAHSPGIGCWADFPRLYLYRNAHCSPGKIAQRGGDCKIQFGGYLQAPGIRPQSVCEIFARSGIAYEWFDDISPELWRKYIFIASLGMVQASFDKTLGQVMESPELSRYLQSAMEEITALGRGQRIDLPEEFVEANCRRARTFCV